MNEHTLLQIDAPRSASPAYITHLDPDALNTLLDTPEEIAAIRRAHAD